jgi:integrase
MTSVEVEGFNIFRDRHGHMRCYHRKTRIAIDLKKAPLGSVAFLAECGRINALAAKIAVPESPRSLGSLIRDYRDSAAFQDLAARTRIDYQRIFDYLQPIADTPLASFNRQVVVLIRDKAAASKGRRGANYVKAVLSILFAWGRERGLVADNPATGIRSLKRPKGTPDANRPWSDTERQIVLDEAPPALRTGLALMMFTGLGPKDALALPRNAVKDGAFTTRRSKTGELVFCALLDPLVAILDAAPPHDAITLCAHSGGLPWSQGGFSASWVLLRKRLEREGRIGHGLTLYGLRHTMAVILRECGYDERTIADALGQKTIEMARHYAKGSNLERKMRGMVVDINAELAKRRREQK